jgi:exopolysaccharide biosynthesis protein
MLPLTRLVRVRWAESKEGKALYLTLEDGLILWAQDPDGALLEEISRALETDGDYAVGGLWKYMWVGGE